MATRTSLSGSNAPGVFDKSNQAYSDSNPPDTLLRTVWPAASVPTPAAGTTQDVTTDGKSITLKAADGAFYRVGETVVRAATTANITLSGTQTIDGIAVVAGDRVLVKNQTTASANGVYDVVAGAAWTRTAGFETAASIAATGIVAVASGTLNGGQLFTTNWRSTDTLNSTAMAFYPIASQAGLAGLPVPQDHGMAGWTYDMMHTQSSSQPTSQQLFVSRIRAAETRSLSNLWCSIGTAGASLTYARMAIYDSAGNQLAITTDQTTNWTSTGIKQCALSAATQVTQGVSYYLAKLTVGTTMPQFHRAGSASLNPNIASSPYRFNSLTGQASMPAALTLTGFTSYQNAFWMAMS